MPITHALLLAVPGSEPSPPRPSRSGAGRDRALSEGIHKQSRRKCSLNSRGSHPRRREGDRGPEPSRSWRPPRVPRAGLRGRPHPMEPVLSPPPALISIPVSCSGAVASERSALRVFPLPADANGRPCSEREECTGSSVSQTGEHPRPPARSFEWRPALPTRSDQLASLSNRSSSEPLRPRPLLKGPEPPRALDTVDRVP